jgi:phosphoketolase
MRPETDALSADELRKMHADWRAANYLSVGQIYLLDNPSRRQRPMALRTRSVSRGSFQARMPFRNDAVKNHNCLEKEKQP